MTLSYCNLQSFLARLKGVVEASTLSVKINTVVAQSRLFAKDTIYDNAARLYLLALYS